MVMMVGGMCARTLSPQDEEIDTRDMFFSASGAAEKRQLLLDPHLESSRSGTSAHAVARPVQVILLPFDARDDGMTISSTATSRAPEHDNSGPSLLPGPRTRRPHL